MPLLSRPKPIIVHGLLRPTSGLSYLFATTPSSVFPLHRSTFHSIFPKRRAMSQIDPVALWSTIGTWTAVLLALIALVGIIGPILVLRAVRSERNEALNSLRDVNQDFLTRGIGIGRNFRFFHRVNVLSLVPTFDSDSKEVFTIPRAEQKWDLQKVKGTKCRATCARLSRLLEAYSVVNDKRGRLVLRDCHS